MRGVGPFAMLVVTLTGCAHSMQRCETLYRDHRYIEAAEAFERTEARLSDESLEDRAEYGLYRGLTYLRLDDLNGARRWLGYAYSVERSAPGSLMSEERALLDRGWVELDQRVAQAGVRRAGSPVAETERAPEPRAAVPPPANGRRNLSE